jgi:hypothetical protein
LGDLHCCEPGVSWRVFGELEYHVYFFEGTEGSFRIEEVDEGKDGEVCGGEDDPGAVGDALEGYGRDEDDATQMLVSHTPGVGMRENEGDIHKIEKPIGARTQPIGGSANPQRHNFDLIQPRHTLPPNGKENRERKQENRTRDSSSLHTSFRPQIL